MNLDNLILELNNRASVARDNVNLSTQEMDDLDKVVDHSIGMFAGPLPKEGKVVLPAAKFKELIENLVRFNTYYGVVSAQGIQKHYEESKSRIIKLNGE